MVCCKLLVIACILFFGGTSGQLRFERHLMNTTATTQNGMEQGLTGMSGLNLDDELTYDNDDDKVVLDKSGETVDVQLSSDGKLILEVCSDGCLDKTVSVCFDAAPGKYNSAAKGECREFNQCGAQGGVIRGTEKKYFWFMLTSLKKEISDGQICENAIMKYETTTASDSGNTAIDSCDPVKHDGNVVRLYVQQAYPGCSIKVLNAKRWFPTTTAPPTTALSPSLLSTPASKSNETESSTSNADTTWWIICGVLGGFLVFLILGAAGFCIYQRHQQKKAAAEKEKADRKAQVISPESLPTLDLSPYIQKEEVKPKKEEVKKDKTETKKKQKKVESAPAPPTVLPSKEGTIEDQPKVEASKVKAAAKVEDVQKEKKAPVAKEGTKRAKKVAKKDVAVATPPPPPRRKAATPKQRSGDDTQEESPSSGRQQDAVDDGSSSPSIEKKPAPKKAPTKKARAKNSLLAPPPRSTSRRPRRNRAPRDLPQYGLNTEEWEDFKAQQNNPLGKVVEWNAKSAKSLY